MQKYYNEIGALCIRCRGTTLYAFPVRSGGENESGALFARQYAASIKYY